MTTDAAIALVAGVLVTLFGTLLKRAVDGVDRKLSALDGVVKALGDKNYEQDTHAAAMQANVGELMRGLGRVEKDTENLRERLNGVADHWRKRFEREADK